MNSSKSYFDVCVVCAMPDEATAFLEELAKHCLEPLEKGFSKGNREYRSTIIQNNYGEKLSVQVSWLPSYGPLQTGLHLDAILKEFKPRFVAMTGICAGDKQKIHLGDLIVAERTFFYDAGKIITSDDGRQKHLYDTHTANISAEILQFVQMFDDWKSAVASISRPPSKRQQRDWLLNKLLNEATPRVDDIDEQELKRYSPDWKRIVQELKKGSDPLLTPQRSLRNKNSIRELRYEEVFPFKDPLQPQHFIVPMGSGNAVRSDNPFDEIRQPVRGTIAIDMEGAAFYHTLQNFPNIRALLVKSVSDYADSDKDDSYHAYASIVSALYMLCFIKEYVTTRLLPRQQTEGTDANTLLAEKQTDTQLQTPINSIGSISAGKVNIAMGEQIAITNVYGLPRRKKKL